MVHKCINNLAPPYLSTLFNTRSSVSKRPNRNDSDLDLPECRLATGQRPFTFRGSKGFNTLPKTSNLSKIQRHSGARCPPTSIRRIRILRLSKYVNIFNIFSNFCTQPFTFSSDSFSHYLFLKLFTILLYTLEICQVG